MSASRGESFALLAVKWGTARIAERVGGDVLVYDVTWTRGSVKHPGKAVALLGFHRTDTPIGKVTKFEDTDEGLVVRGYPVGSASDRERIAALVGEELQHEVSVGFVGSDADTVARPATRGGVPLVTRRGVMLREVSLVSRAAISGSRVLSLAPEGHSGACHGSCGRSCGSWGVCGGRAGAR